MNDWIKIIKGIRFIKGLTQEELANEIGVARTQLLCIVALTGAFTPQNFFKTFKYYLIYKVSYDYK